MSDNQFKQFLRQQKRLLEDVTAQDTREAMLAKIEAMIEDINKGLED